MRIALGCSAAALILLAACGGGHKTTVYTGNGTATVTTENGGKTTTISSKSGSVTVGKGAVDVAKLGAPVYPGAEQGDDSAAMTVNTKTGSGTMASFTSNDPFDKVYGWYKSQLPKGAEKMKVSQGDSSMAEFLTGEEATGQTMVMLSVKSGKTQILISHDTKSGKT